jgi:hypothetical protein
MCVQCLAQRVLRMQLSGAVSFAEGYSGRIRLTTSEQLIIIPLQYERY